MRSHGRIVPDFMFPAGQGKNRNEDILVEYDGIIHSLNESIFYGLILLPEYHDRIPMIKKLSTINPEKFYYDYSIMPLFDFLMMLRDGDESLTIEELAKAADEAVKIDTYELHQMTMMNYALQELSTVSYVKSITIINQRTFEDYEVRLIRNTFASDPEKQCKLKLFVGDTLSQLEDNTYTTILVNELDDVMQMLNNKTRYHVEESAILLRNHLGNTKIIPATEAGGNERVEELMNDEIYKLTKMTACKVGRFNADIFTEENLAPPTLGLLPGYIS